MGYHYYCPICGQTLFPNNTICTRCKNFMTPIQSLHDASYYQNKSMKKVGDYSRWSEILIDEEVSKNPLYNPNTTIHNAEEEYNRRLKESNQRYLQQELQKRARENNRPICPTCGSVSVEKISNFDKAFKAALFGSLSGTGQQGAMAYAAFGKDFQFKCNKCGYKW